MEFVTSAAGILYQWQSVKYGRTRVFSLPGIAALLVFVFVRPQEFIPAIARFPFLYLFSALAVLGLVIDIRLRHAMPRLTPQMPFVFVLWVWIVITTVVKASDTTMMVAISTLIVVIMFSVIAHGAQSFKGLETVAILLLTFALALAVVAIHQGHQPLQCLNIDMTRPGDMAGGRPDGRPCDIAMDCYTSPGAEPGVMYRCERAGLFGTTTVGGRVRYRGVLQDPNELAVLMGSCLALAFVLGDRRKTRLAKLARMLAVLTLGYAVILTKSRGGMLVVFVVAGGYFVRRFGLRGLVPGVALAVPVALLGGRSGEGASESTMQRLEAWRDGINMLRASPVFGVGCGQFVNHHGITAHNSYVLAFAELGYPGFVLWSIVLYLSLKIPFVGTLRYRQDPDAEVAADWGVAILICLLGLMSGILFLSMTYHSVIWCYLALSGGYFLAVRRHDPSFEVRLRLSELVLLGVLTASFIVVLEVYLRMRYI